jgi:hypothetical protein
MIAVEVTVLEEALVFAAVVTELTPETVTLQTFHAIPVGTEVIVQVALPDGLTRCYGTVQCAVPTGLTIALGEVPPSGISARRRKRVRQSIS